MAQKAIEGFPYEITDNGQIWSIKSKIFLQLRYDDDGYLRVGLHNKGKYKSFGVHRLVAEAFIPNPDNLPEVNHKNGIRDDNRAENLEWSTHAENSGKKRVSKTCKKIPHGKIGKYTVEGVRLAVYGTYAEAARDLREGKAAFHTKETKIREACFNNRYDRSNYYCGYYWRFEEEESL